MCVYRCRVMLSADRRALASFAAVALVVWAPNARASSMDGLAVVLVAVCVALPAAVILLGMIIAMGVALGSQRPGIVGARLVQFASPPLALVYPLVFLVLGDTRNAETALFFDLPVIALAAVAFVLACLVARKHARLR